MLGWCRRHDTEKGHLLTDVAVPAVEIDGVTKRYGRTLALDNVSFQVRPGELFALLGPNGAGKTTLLHILCTILKPDCGTARIGGIDVIRHPLDGRRHDMGAPTVKGLNALGDRAPCRHIDMRLLCCSTIPRLQPQP